MRDNFTPGTFKEGDEFYIECTVAAKSQVYVKNAFIRKKNAGNLIVDGAITAQKIAANSIEGDRIKANSLDAAKIRAFSIQTENLNVLARRIIDPFVEGTKEGWTAGGTVTGLGRALLLTTPNHNFLSNVFEALPNDVYEFKFGLQSLSALSGSLGLYIGLTSGQPFNVYQYNFTSKTWVLSASNNTNAYFVHNYITAARKYFKTYILGSNVDIADAGAPSYTDTAYAVCSLKLTGAYTSCRIRSGYNSGQPANTSWYLIQPQVYKIGEGKIVANQILVNDLMAVSSVFGKIRNKMRQEYDFTNAKPNLYIKNYGNKYP
jgi:hypothetical protein